MEDTKLSKIRTKSTSKFISILLIGGIIWLNIKVQVNYVGSYFSPLEIWALQLANFIARRYLGGNLIQAPTVYIAFKEA